ncbi:MAG: hypothetical protein M3328_06945 [Chloroflexota bacterium]|nr:hypothetical protein [Chloroflexota bacterium]
MPRHGGALACVEIPGACLVISVLNLSRVGVAFLENFAFEREIRPAAPTGDVLMAAIKGASPLLAPGILLFAALLGLAATYYHPALGERDIA